MHHASVKQIRRRSHAIQKLLRYHSHDSLKQIDAAVTPPGNKWRGKPIEVVSIYYTVVSLLLSIVSTFGLLKNSNVSPIACGVLFL